MKTLLALGTLVLLSCLPARAQTYLGTNSSSYSGSALNSGMNGMEKAYFPSHYSLPNPPSQMSIISGTDVEFVPSLFMCYDKALARGVADLAVKPKTIVEVAAEHRNEQRAKAQATFVQDANGKLVRAE
jgi:hypothetical protein